MQPLKEAKAAGKDVKLIWVDSDGFLTAPEYKDIMLSSVMKLMGEAVETVVKEDKDGKFTNTPYVGTLANDGVQLAPFHDLDSAGSGRTEVRAGPDQEGHRRRQAEGRVRGKPQGVASSAKRHRPDGH